MTLPTAREEGAEHPLGTSSLELVRARSRRAILDDPSLTPPDRTRLFEELDGLIEYERQRRVRMDIRRRELEELEHRIALAHRLAGAIREMRLATARTESEVATYAQGNRQRELDILERILQLRVKYKPAETLDAHVKELRQLKRHQQLADAKEQAVLDSIAKRVRHRAAYIQLVNEKFPDMADELIDFYDQQVFRRGTRM